MRVLGILWNGMQDHLGEALEDISKYGEVQEAFTINLGDSYEDFVRDIYAQDTIAEWKVNKKLETMFQCSDSRKITIVIVDVDTPKKEFHPLKKRMVYTNLENMKVNIRKKYMAVWADRDTSTTEELHTRVIDINHSAAPGDPSNPLRFIVRSNPIKIKEKK